MKSEQARPLVAHYMFAGIVTLLPAFDGLPAHSPLDPTTIVAHNTLAQRGRTQGNTGQTAAGGAPPAFISPFGR